MITTQRHTPTGEHHNAEKDRWEAWCDSCGQALHGFDDWDDDRGPIFIGWFHDSLNEQGLRVGSTVCQSARIAS